jgi:hypothetical protein
VNEEQETSEYKQPVLYTIQLCIVDLVIEHTEAIMDILPASATRRRIERKVAIREATALLGGTQLRRAPHPTTWDCRVLAGWPSFAAVYPIQGTKVVTVLALVQPFEND